MMKINMNIEINEFILECVCLELFTGLNRFYRKNFPPASQSILISLYILIVCVIFNFLCIFQPFLAPAVKLTRGRG